MRPYSGFVQPLVRQVRARLPLGVGLMIALAASLALWGAGIWIVLKLLKNL